MSGSSVSGFHSLKMWNNFFSVFPRFREKLGVKTVKALKRNNNGVTHAAIDMLCALMCVSTTSSTSSTCVFLINKAMSLVLTDLDPLSLSLSSLFRVQPMHDDYDLRQEQLNKASLLSSKKFLENLLEKFITNVVNFCFCFTASAVTVPFVMSCWSFVFSCFCFFNLQDHGTGALVISSLLDFLTFALCAPYSETTEGQQFDMLLEMVASNGRTLFKLFQVFSLNYI